MSLCEPNSIEGSHEDIKAQRSVLPTNNIRTTTAERAVFNNLGQMPPAAAAFVVGGDCGPNWDMRNILWGICGFSITKECRFSWLSQRM
jgi:hypothetical protein